MRYKKERIIILLVMALLVGGVYGCGSNAAVNCAVPDAAI